MTTYTVNEDSGLGGTAVVDLFALGAETSITSVSITVTCQEPGATYPVALVSFANTSGGSPYSDGTTTVSGVAQHFEGASVAYLGLVSFPPPVGAGFSSGTATVSYVPDTALTVDGYVRVQALDGGMANDAEYRIVAVTLNEDPPDPEPEPVVLPADVQVYEEDNTTLVCSLTHNDDPELARQVRALKGRVSLDEEGDGAVEVDHDHPQIGELTGGRFIQVHEGDRVPLAFRIRETRRVLRSGSGKSSGRTLRAGGYGPLGITKHGTVQGWVPYGQKPTTRRRKFDWSSPPLDTTDWSPAVVHFRLTSEPGKPYGTPSLFNTHWIGAEEEDPLMTVGSWCVRRQFEMPVASQLSIFSSADDHFVDCVEGVEIQDVSPPFPALVWPYPWRTPVELTDTEHIYTYAAKVTNLLGPTAFISDAWTTSAGGLVDQVFMTGEAGLVDPEYDPLYGEWICFLNPAGEWFTVGEIVRILLEECQARGELLDVTLGFTDSLDSAGNTWPKIEAEVDVGKKLFDALERLRIHADFAMSHEGLVLDAWTKDPGRGEASGIDVTYAAGEIQSDAIETSFEIENVAILEHDKGHFEYESALSVLAYGRYPGDPLPVGSITDPVVLEQLAIAHLMPRTTPIESRPVEVTHLAEFTAAPGDTVTVEGDELRVMEIGFDLDIDGTLRKVPALNTARQERVKRQDRIVQQLIADRGDSRGSAKVLDTGTGLEPGKIEPETIESWSWRDSDELEPEYWDVDEEEPRAWQTFTVKEARRLTGLEVKCEWAEPDGFGDIEQVTTGDTVIRLILNGQATTPLFEATVPAINPEDSSNPKVAAVQFILGEGLVIPEDELSVVCIQNGGHVNGSAAIVGVTAS